MLEINGKAPIITLPDRNGKIRSTEEFKGKKTVVFFYSKDSTSGCTSQALGYAELYEKFKKAGAEVIGISRDTVQSHKKFAEKYNFPFILLSDTELEAIKAYGVWGEKKLYGKTTFGTVRSTFVIDEEGRLVSARRKVNAKRTRKRRLK